MEENNEKNHRRTVLNLRRSMAARTTDRDALAVYGNGNRRDRDRDITNLKPPGVCALND